MLPDSVAVAAAAGLDPWTKDILQAAAWLIAAIGGIFAILKGVAEISKSTAERAEARRAGERDLRWRQAETAKKVLDELAASPQARAAMKMLDWSGLTYLREGDVRTKPITNEFVTTSLRTSNLEFRDPDEPFVRDAFDGLLDGFERLEHFVRIGLVLWEDVQPPLVYYAERLRGIKPVIDPYLATFRFPLAAAFLARFER